MTTYVRTIRELIVREVKELFENFSFVSIDNPGIYRGRAIFDDDSENPPLITILPRIEESTRNQYNMVDNIMPVDIICLERLAGQNPSEFGEAILGELIACTFGKSVDGEKFGGLSTTYADDIFYRSGGIEAYPDELGQQIIHVGISVAVHYQTDAGDPYSH